MKQIKIFYQQVSKLVVLPLLFIINACSSENPLENLNNKAAVEDVKTAFGEKVFEVILTEANVLYVSVEDNGVDQSRFAETVCNILKSHNATTNWVKVVKVGSARDSKADNAYGILLGDAHCN